MQSDATNPLTELAIDRDAVRERIAIRSKLLMGCVMAVLLVSAGVGGLITTRPISASWDLLLMGGVCAIGIFTLGILLFIKIERLICQLEVHPDV